jgi:hypothetical protein
MAKVIDVVVQLSGRIVSHACVERCCSGGCLRGRAGCCG